MKLLVDGVFFQLAQSGIARVWSALLPRLAGNRDLDIVLLDRGNAPNLEGTRRIAFPAYNGKSTAANSFLIEQIGMDFGADVFISTYYTTPVTIPSVLLIYDMIPELFGFDMSNRIWQEKEVAIAYARRFVCISKNTQADFLRLHPEIPADRTAVAHCGVDTQIFYPRPPVEVEKFRREHNLDRPYYLFVGSSEQHKGYKNAGIFFETLKRTRDASVDVLCVGGEPEIQPALIEALPSGVRLRHCNLSDDALACAYSGSEALVFSSLYEGFGLPIIEAFASGCPVVTTPHGSLGEVAGDAAEFISGRDVAEMSRALDAVRNPLRRAELVSRGRSRASTFSWDAMAERLQENLAAVAVERSKAKQFFAEWKRLRNIQLGVDTSC